MFNVASTSEILVAQKKEKFRIVLNKYYKIVEWKTWLWYYDFSSGRYQQPASLYDDGGDTSL